MPYLPLFVALAAAVGALVTPRVPWPWPLCFALPALLLALCARRQALRPPHILGTAILAAGSIAALRAFEPADDVVPLASSLLGPLVFFALRGRSGDLRQALFFGLCATTVGMILDAAHAWPFVVAFGVSATVTLAMETMARARAARAAVRVARAGGLVTSARLAGVVLACAAIAACLHEILRALPVPRTGPQTADGRRTQAPSLRQGLSDQFDLGSGGSWLDVLRDLQGNALASVEVEGGPVADDLYLRFTYFDLAGANRWTTGRVVTRPQPTPDAWDLRQRSRRWRTTSYTITRAPQVNGHLLLPPGAWRVEGIADIVGHADLHLLREAKPSGDTLRYRVRAHDVPQDLTGHAIAPAFASFVTLPESLLEDDITGLAERYTARAGNDPFRRALAIAEALRRDYTYTRREPTGPYGDALRNFLFAERRGYCMYFASAMAVLLRAQRIPCRIGVGLYGGRPDPQIAGRRVYGDADAHAWVEIPFLGFGWVVFDPTPPEARAAAGRALDALEGPLTRTEAQQSATTAGDAAPLHWGWAAALLAALLMVPRWRRAERVIGPRADSLPNAHPARRHLDRLLAELHAQRRWRDRGEPLGCYVRRVATSTETARVLDDGVAAFEEVRFGRIAWSAEHAARMQAAVTTAHAMGVAAEVAEAAEAT